MKDNKIEITPEIFDTFNVDYNSIENSIIIPFNKNSKNDNLDTYIKVFEDRFNLRDKNFILIVLVEAKKGHQIYNYDGNYNYYIGAIVSIKGISQLIKKDISKTISELEKEYIENIIWNHRDVLPTLQKQVEEKLNEMGDDKKILFSQSLVGNQYHGTFKSLDNNKISFIIIEDYKKGMSAIQIQNITIAS